MPIECWDVIVVGGGPAGCAAALRVHQADPAARVLILDRAAFPRDKVCGDGIAAQAFHALVGLGVERADITAGFSPVRRLLLRSPGGHTVDRPMRDEVYVIPRRVFDARLMDAARSRGAVFRQHTVRRAEESADGVLVDGRWRARVVIGADGAESTVRRAQGMTSNRPKQMAVAVRGYAPDLPGRGSAQLITMSRRRWPSYAWSFPTGNGTSNVGYGELMSKDPSNRSALLDRMRSLLTDLGPEVTELRGHRLPLSTGRPTVRPGRVLLVGDALSLINPLSGEGIYYAIRSGMTAGEAASAGAGAGLRYRKLLRRRLGRHLRHTGTLALLMRRPALIDAGVQAAARHQRAFDDLVDLALGDGLITGRLIGHLRP